jgi:hypothetical protein
MFLTIKLRISKFVKKEMLIMMVFVMIGTDNWIHLLEQELMELVLLWMLIWME